MVICLYHKAGAFARTDLPGCYQPGKDLFLQQVFRNCNKKGMHAVVYYLGSIPVIRNIPEIIYQPGILKFRAVSSHHPFKDINR